MGVEGGRCRVKMEAESKYMIEEAIVGTRNMLVWKGRRKRAHSDIHIGCHRRLSRRH